MGVLQYTTPTFTLVFEEQGLDLTQANNVYVTFRSGANSITKDSDSLVVREKEIEIYLTQEETGKFRVGDVEIQANWTNNNGWRAGSEKVLFNIDENLLKKVVE